VLLGRYISDEQLEKLRALRLGGRRRRGLGQAVAVGWWLNACGCLCLSGVSVGCGVSGAGLTGLPLVVVVVGASEEEEKGHHVCTDRIQEINNKDIRKKTNRIG